MVVDELIKSILPYKSGFYICYNPEINIVSLPWATNNTQDVLYATNKWGAYPDTVLYIITMWTECFNEWVKKIYHIEYLLCYEDIVVQLFQY